MSLLARNAYLTTYPVSLCLNLGFPDHRPNLVMRSGKIVPTPNRIARALAKSLAVDSAIIPHRSGKVQQILISDPGFAQALGKRLGCPAFKVDPLWAYCRASSGRSFDLKEQVKLAHALGLI